MVTAGCKPYPSLLTLQQRRKTLSTPAFGPPTPSCVINSLLWLYPPCHVKGMNFLKLFVGIMLCRALTGNVVGPPIYGVDPPDSYIQKSSIHSCLHRIATLSS